MNNPFDCFPRTLPKFLAELRDNNNRDWFEANKSRFEAEAQNPALDFVEAFRPSLERLSPSILAVAKKSGGSLLRIYRDARFSKDKTPYHAYLAAHFGHREAAKAPSACFYFKVTPEDLFLGAGVYRPDAATAQTIRAAIDARSSDWSSLTSETGFRELFGAVSGEQLKRPPRGFSAEHAWIKDLKRKEWAAIRKVRAGAATKPGFLAEVERTYRAAWPFVRFLNDALGLKG